MTGAIVLGGDYQGLGIVRSLGRHGVHTLLVDDEVSIARTSRHTTGSMRVPSLRDDEAVLAALAAARTRYAVDGWVLYPTRDEMVAAIARHRDELLAHFRVPTPAWDCVRAAWDKRETYRLAQRLGVPVPRTWFPAGEDDLEQVDTSGPVIVKPAIKERFFYATRAKAWRADGADELRDRYRRAAEIIGPDEVIVQELVPGDGQYSYCVLNTGPSMTVRRTRQHPSDFGRASTFVETVERPALAGPAALFLRAIGHHGLAELEFKHDPRDGADKLLDVNLRTWGYHTLGAAAGVDFAYLLFRDETGEAAASVRARPGVKWIRLVTDVPNAIRDMRAGRLRLGSYTRSLRGIDTEAVFSWRDPLPGLSELALLPYLAVRRGL